MEADRSDRRSWHMVEGLPCAKLRRERFKRGGRVRHLYPAGGFPGGPWQQRLRATLSAGVPDFSQSAYPAGEIQELYLGRAAAAVGPLQRLDRLLPDQEDRGDRPAGISTHG